MLKINDWFIDFYSVLTYNSRSCDDDKGGYEAGLHVSQEPESFFCHTLDCPFTDKGNQAYKLKWSPAALGQSAFCRRTWTIIIIVTTTLVVAIDKRVKVCFMGMTCGSFKWCC